MAHGSADAAGSQACFGFQDANGDWFDIPGQAEPNSCAMAAGADGLRDLGYDATESQLRALNVGDAYDPLHGTDLRLLSENLSTQFPGLQTSLDEFGDPTAAHDALCRSLDAGQSAVVGVDPAMMEGLGDSATGHAVTVKQYDPISDRYTLYDPVGHGRLVWMEGERFRHAWADVGFPLMRMALSR